MTVRFPQGLMRPVFYAALALSAAMAQAAPHGPEGGPARHEMGMPARALQAAGVTPAQQSQIEAIMKQAREDLRAQHQAAGDLHQQMNQLLAAPTVDAAAAESLRQKMLAQHDSASRRMLQARLQVAALLTPEQRQKLAAQQAQHQGKRREHRHEAAPGQ
ncbi:Spy/CpxP family protein refolding chaperone [Roseateles sp. BYS180W]|uniref:Spy/CpxP family protein refolding chaperone n=1 Tax=Roseateles rivi TaxID=3299028 RepID=A0ABW7FTG9_9BURK